MVVIGGVRFLMSEVHLYTQIRFCRGIRVSCKDRVLDGPASGEEGSKGRNWLDCIRGKGVRALIFRKESCQHRTTIPRTQGGEAGNRNDFLESSSRIFTKDPGIKFWFPACQDSRLTHAEGCERQQVTSPLSERER